MRNCYVAIDIGASSGRLMKSSKIGKYQITLEEIHRFKNGFSQKNGKACWQMDQIIHEILIGLEKLKASGINECYVGIDTWAVDYCLINKSGERLGDPIAYRDDRTKKAIEQFTEKMSLTTLYEKTGIQIQAFNTLFQLLVEEKEKIKQADCLLLIPDYLNYVFTGKKYAEHSNASTTQLLNVLTKTWDEDILSILEISSDLFPPLIEEGTLLGPLQREKFSKYDLPESFFIAVASHDTASAVVGTPAVNEKDSWGFLSSGTWSLLGIETKVPVVSSMAFNQNYTNEWGANNTIRFLKNIMGMWLIQEVARMQDYTYSYTELANLAQQEMTCEQFIDINHTRFLKPVNMINELQLFCQETQQKIPQTPGELASCVYNNLSLCYALELEQLTKLTTITNKLDYLHIVGGGSNNQLLNQLTANLAGIPVESGPSEATAIGNILIQMIANHEFSSLIEGRRAVKYSFENRLYLPQPATSQSLAEYKKWIQRSVPNDKY